MNDVKLEGMRASWLWVALLVAACGPGRKAETLQANVYSPGVRATPEQCNQLATHLEVLTHFVPVTAQDQGSLRVRSESPVQRIRFVDRCTRMLSQRDWACLMRAGDQLNAERCGERRP
jgi:hypothetical protein